MLSKSSIALATLLVAAGICFAQQSTETKPEIKKQPIQQTNPASGKEMYMQYCAACHGADGKGNGPAASSLKTPPPDLTLLAKNHDGKFPASAVSSVLKFGAGPGSHGSSDMPVWGPLFQSLDKYHDGVVQQRISNVVKYIEGLQAK